MRGDSERWDALVEEAKALPHPTLTDKQLRDGRRALVVSAQARANSSDDKLRKRVWPWAFVAAAASVILWLGSTLTIDEPSTAPVVVAAPTLPEPVPTVETTAATGVDNGTAKVDPVATARKTTLAAKATPPAKTTKNNQERKFTSDSEVAFQQGWAALRRGDSKLAARWLSRVSAESPIAPDAQYWQGVALSRSGQKHEAIAVLESFVDAYPNEIRRTRAAVLVGRLLAEEHQRQRASGYLALGLLANDATTKQEAQRLLNALDSL